MNKTKEESYMKLNLNGKTNIVVEGDYVGTTITLDTEGVITYECGYDENKNSRTEIDEYTIVKVAAPTLLNVGSVYVLDGKKGKEICCMFYKKKSLAAVNEFVSALEANNVFVAMEKDEYTDIADSYVLNCLKITNDGKLVLCVARGGKGCTLYFHTPEDVEFVYVSDDGVHIKYKNKESCKGLGLKVYGYYAVTNKAKKFKGSADAFANNLRDLGYKVKRFEKFMMVIEVE